MFLGTVAKEQVLLIHSEFVPAAVGQLGGNSTLSQNVKAIEPVFPDSNRHPGVPFPSVGDLVQQPFHSFYGRLIFRRWQIVTTLDGIAPRGVFWHAEAGAGGLLHHQSEQVSS